MAGQGVTVNVMEQYYCRSTLHKMLVHQHYGMLSLLTLLWYQCVSTHGTNACQHYGMVSLSTLWHGT